MRIAVCFGTYPPERNGGADFLARFAASLGEAGAEVHVLTSPADASDREEPAPGVTVHRVVDDWSLGRSTLRRTNELLRSERVELLHVLFPDSVLQARYRLPALLGRGLPLVTTFWNLGLGRRSPASVRATALAILARSRALTSHDPGYLRVLRRVAAGRPVQWLPVGSNLPAVARPAKREGRLLGYFGQLDPTRGVEDLFEALRFLRRERDARLVMIGSAGREERYAADPPSHAYLREMLALPERLGIADAVTWTAYLGDREAAELLASLDLCVLPYRRNSLGRSALAAALDLGVPTVLAGTDASIEPLRAGRHVVLVPQRDPGALSAAIGRLLDDPGELDLLAEGARAAAAFFAWPRIAASALDVYRRAL